MKKDYGNFLTFASFIIFTKPVNSYHINSSVKIDDSLNFIPK